jgi:hypothetical protein
VTELVKFGRMGRDVVEAEPTVARVGVQGRAPKINMAKRSL